MSLGRPEHFVKGYWKRFFQWLLGVIGAAMAAGGLLYLFADWFWKYAGLAS